MNLAHCLENLNQEEIRQVLEQLRSYGISSLPEASRALLSPAFLARLLVDVNSEELAALKMISFSPNEQGAIVEQVHQKLNSLTHKWRRNSAQVVMGLRRRGLVFAARLNYREVYFVPIDLRQVLVDHFSAEMALPLLRGDVEVQEVPGAPLPMLRNVYLFLSYVRKNPLEIAQSGLIYRRQLKRFLDLIGVADEEPPLKNRFEEPYPEPFRLVYAYCLERGQVANREGRLELQRPETLLQAPLEDQCHDLFRFWQERFPDRHRDLRLIAPVLSHTTDHWLDLETLAQTFEPLNIAPSPRDSFLLRLRSMFFNHLAYLGIVRLGHLGGKEVCRLTNVGRCLLGLGDCPDSLFATDLYLQPNFEILAPSNLRPDLLWQLEKMADPEKLDQMMTYRLTRDSIYQALASGLTGEEILGFFQTHARTSLPQNVE
ncbi:MAG: helicase-associated domain-containing protein, partial [Firmicutes bacterium]|nr:helicase-associated domain-containing protein [Bacillota bacterium]